MKRRNLFITLGLSLALGAGALAGALSSKEVKEAKAAELESYSGSFAIYLPDLGDGHYWDDANAKIAVKIYNNEDAGEMGSAWSDLVSTTSGTHKYIIPYTTSSYFDPFAGAHTKIDVYRFNPEVVDPVAGSTEGGTWNSFSGANMGTYINVTGWNAGSTSTHWIGATSNSWTKGASNILRNAKLNAGVFEFYNDIALSNSDELKLYVNGDAYDGKFSCDPTLSSIITGNLKDNIHCSTADTYRMYYNESTYSLHITTPKYVIADEYAQFFLAEVGCDESGVDEPSGWSTVAAAYPTNGEARDFICSADPVKAGTYLQQCVYWYKVAITQHPGLTKFMVNSSDQARQFSYVNVPVIMDRDSNTIVIVLATFAALSLIAATGYFYVRRRKESR